MTRETRIIQLVAREGMLADLLTDLEFPTENHRKIIQLIYEETLEELASLGVVPEDEDRFDLYDLEIEE
jgi:hypothetical protein